MKSIILQVVVLLATALLVTGASPNNLGTPANYHHFDLPFYAETVAVTYDPAMTIAEPPVISNQALVGAYRTLQRKPTKVLLNSLLEAKAKYALNDYLFYKLASQTLKVVYQNGEENAREITMYGLLIEAGFDARLTFRGGRVFVNVFTEEDLFEVPIIDANGRPYANLSCMEGDCNGRARLFIHPNRPNPKGRSFGFQLRSWPTLGVQPIAKKLSFSYHGVDQEMDVTFDRTIVDIMKDYPFIHEYCYLETPLSATLQESLIPQLDTLIRDLPQQQALEFLVSFTRSAFDYKEDNENFGRSKPMVPEELFGYSFSDCEDRSALFFALVRELLEIPMAVIAYDDHLTIAVGSDTIPGDFFTYEGKRFVFCDPTGPKNSSKIGQIPPGYENKSFQIIGAYK
ncbi:hypothetical protein [Neolewinella antarctica]|uniref:Transglutaminase-like domain-containing protein n=1 Tax=Neolewinella antarctica TaxID=442734 RepID=A0ABX0XAT5_9BACT|nr:hypothetical protein [Neolewinella antarctica]NJC26054.1 hypothetical protein [Neolewinella antarctica]